MISGVHSQKGSLGYPPDHEQHFGFSIENDRAPPIEKVVAVPPTISHQFDYGTFMISKEETAHIRTIDQLVPGSSGFQ
jgi:hypothetical protein